MLYLLLKIYFGTRVSYISVFHFQLPPSLEYLHVSIKFIFSINKYGGETVEKWKTIINSISYIQNYKIFSFKMHKYIIFKN